MGMPENFTDRTRHAVLYESPQEDLPHPELPVSDPNGQRDLLRAALKKAVSTIAICTLYAIAISCAAIFHPELLFRGSLGTIFLGITAIVFLPCLYYSIKAASLYRKAVHSPETDNSAGDFLCLDGAVILSYIMLGILAVYLILDFII